MQMHGSFEGFPRNYTVVKVEWLNPPKGGLVRGHDKPRLMGVVPSTFQVDYWVVVSKIFYFYLEMWGNDAI